MEGFRFRGGGWGGEIMREFRVFEEFVFRRVYGGGASL